MAANQESHTFLLRLAEGMQLAFALNDVMRNRVQPPLVQGAEEAGHGHAVT
jgi:hypothetical protein